MSWLSTAYGTDTGIWSEHLLVASSEIMDVNCLGFLRMVPKSSRPPCFYRLIVIMNPNPWLRKFNPTV